VNREAYADKAADHAAMCKWFRCFKGGHQSLEDGAQKGGPVAFHN